MIWLGIPLAILILFCIPIILLQRKEIMNLGLLRGEDQGYITRMLDRHANELHKLQQENDHLRNINQLSTDELLEVIKIFKEPKKISKVLKTKKISSKNVEQELKDSFKDNLDIF